MEKRLQVQWSHARGLHLRPASQIARCVSAGNCRVQFQCCNRSADALSALDLLTLAIQPGDLISIRVAGAGSSRLAAQLQDLLRQWTARA